ncbi:MAG: DUF899 family protein [Phycisphaeraceae bacterium]|nr:DUF899 family protein [Phycisphaerales bacterium]MCB9843146.1 DUF899 family protein [Phycisphaeraceae bacterium]
MNKAHEEIQMLDKQIMELKKKRTDLWRKAPRQSFDNYTLRQTDGGEVSLADLFGDKSELILIHNMGKSCPYCTLWADGFIGFTKHLENRAAFALCSPDEPATLKQFAESRGWNFRTISCHGSDFASDAGFEPEPGKYLPGVSCFRKRADGAIERTGMSFFGPGDDFCSLWHLLDLLDNGPDGWQPKYKY